jgi:small multidrug resistance family-3 protein
MDIVKSILLFIIAGFFEISGGYQIWLYLREGRGIEFAIIGAIILVLYGIIPTLQPANFGRVYAAYGRYFYSPFTSMGMGD